jgi:hypothetical protein
MTDDNEDLYAEFESDTPNIVGSSAQVAAFDTFAMAIDHVDSEDNNERTYHDVLGEWLRDHPDDSIAMILAMLDIAVHLGRTTRMAISDEGWNVWFDHEHDRLAAQNILTQSAYADEMGDEEDDDAS